MSDMLPDPNDPNDPENIVRGEAFRQAAEQLMERAGAMKERAEKIGLYIEGPPHIIEVPTPFGSRPALVQQFQIGRVAYQKRIQDPESDKFDDQFRVMEVEAQDDAFLDERERIRKALEEGRDPYAPEED